MSDNNNISMSVGHLDHVLSVYSWMEHVTWKSQVVLHWAVKSSQTVIKMSNGHQNVVVRWHTSVV